MPTVSVILNCYNHAPYVAEAIESVLAQTYEDFELILIDNGSTDGSRAVLDRYDDPRIRCFYHPENLALSRRLNEGVATATGEFVCILYSDDMMLPDKLERQMALFAGAGPEVGVVYCPAIGLNHHTGERWQYPSMGREGAMMPALLQRHFDGAVDMCSPLIRRKCFLSNHWHEDHPGDGEAIFFRIAFDWAFRFDSTPTVVLRDHGKNWGRAIIRNYEMAQVIFKRLPEHPSFRPEWRKSLQQFLSKLGSRTAWSLLRSNSDIPWAQRAVRETLKVDPWMITDPRTAAALLLSAMPTKLRSRLNRFGDQIKSRMLIRSEPKL